MKKRLFAVAGLMALCSFGATEVARAQEPMKVNIPFAFSVGEKMLPPGEYRVEKLQWNNFVLLVRSTDSNVSAMVHSNSKYGREQQTKSKLVFHRYNDSYFLAEVWNAGNSIGRELPKSPREKEIALTAKAETQSQVVLLASLAPAKP